VTGKNLTIFFCLVLSVLAFGCSSTSVTKKFIIDSSLNKPDWVDKNSMYWSTDDGHYYKSMITIRGDQRLNGGYIIASNENRERLIRDISDRLKGKFQEVIMNLSENAEYLLNKARSGEFEGTIYGMRDMEQYFERYELVNEETKERIQKIDCYLLSFISNHDYAKTEQVFASQIIEVDPRIKEAMTQGMIKFFDEDSGASQAQGNN